MINWIDKTIVFGGKVEPIIRTETWFKTPFGLCANLDDALEACKTADLDPMFCVVPVPVFLSETMHEVRDRL